MEDKKFCQSCGMPMEKEDTGDYRRCQEVSASRNYSNICGERYIGTESGESGKH